MTVWDAYYEGRDNSVGTHAIFNKLMQVYITEADRILELGAGVGINIPDIAHFGRYYAIEGSAYAVSVMHQKFPNLRDRIVCHDFTKGIPFENGFDAIVERASIAHNDLAGIVRAVDNVYDALKPGGIFVSSDWFSVRHSEFIRGHNTEDICTHTDYTDGQFAGVGNVHFSSEAELLHIFKRFDRLFLQERQTIRKGPGFAAQCDRRKFIAPCFEDCDYVSAVWDIVCRRPL